MSFKVDIEKFQREGDMTNLRFSCMDRFSVTLNAQEPTTPKYIYTLDAQFNDS